MIITQFLCTTRYSEYADWLKQQDADTRNLYFGITATDSAIDELMAKITANPDDHKFLVAIKNNQWAGTVHIAINANEVEFGIIVLTNMRGMGIGSQLIDEAILWARNRGFRELSMYCLTWNRPIMHLCHKHGLESKNLQGTSEVKLQLPPPNLVTLSREVTTRNRNMFHMFLQGGQFSHQEIYG